MEDIADIDYFDSLRIAYESTITGIITSIGLVEERYTCPKCYSTNVERNDKTIRCITWK